MKLGKSTVVSCAVAALATGDADGALGLLYPEARRLARYMFGRRSVDQDEVVQVTMTRMWPVLGRVDLARPETAGAYVSRSLRMGLLMAYRDHLKTSEHSEFDEFSYLPPRRHRATEFRLGEQLPGRLAGLAELAMEYLQDHDTLHGFGTWAGGRIGVSKQRVSRLMEKLKGCLAEIPDVRSVIAAP